MNGELGLHNSTAEEQNLVKLRSLLKLILEEPFQEDHLLLMMKAVREAVDDLTDTLINIIIVSFL